MRRHSSFLILAVACALLFSVACHDKGGGSNKSSRNLLNLAPEGDGDTVIVLEADPSEIVIDTTDPGAPKDPGSGKFLGETGIQATVADLDGNMLVGVEVLFSTTAGTLASNGQPVLTDAQGIATDTLTVLEDDPSPITVTATVGDDSMTLEVILTVILPNQPPIADAGMNQSVECTLATGTPVMLDGSGSSDPDSTPGTNDDIVSFEWLVDGSVIATGEMVQVSFPLGMTTVTLRVTDSEGLTDEAQIVIDIFDIDPPTLTVTPSPSMLWPPNHKLRHVNVVLDPSDTCSPSPVVRLVDVTSNEPDNGTGDGDTSDDIQGLDTGTADTEILLRAERAGGGNGRTYTLLYSVTDDAGNVGEGQATVQVPHDQGH